MGRQYLQGSLGNMSIFREREAGREGESECLQYKIMKRPCESIGSQCYVLRRCFCCCSYLLIRWWLPLSCHLPLLEIVFEVLDVDFVFVSNNLRVEG